MVLSLAHGIAQRLAVSHFKEILASSEHVASDTFCAPPLVCSAISLRQGLQLLWSGARRGSALMSGWRGVVDGLEARSADALYSRRAGS